MKKIVTVGLMALSMLAFGSKRAQKTTEVPASRWPAQYILVNGVDATPEAFREIASVFPRKTDRPKAAGVGFILSYFQMSPEDAANKLKKYLSLSEAFDLPVIVQLDGEQWWGNRPDLWNWWDQEKPGYHPDNRKNVEWSAWSPDSAVKIGWRNWGRQLRVLPMPNLMSRAYREACHAAMKQLVPIVMNWWHALPSEKKYLLVGIKVGWESAIGVNNWYYPNGNRLLNQSEKVDPTYGLKTDSLPDRGVTAIGYASVSTLGLATSGKLKEKHLTEVVRLHLEDLCRFMSDLGVPRDRLFTHCGGWSKRETLYTAAVNPYACPGWSFYQYASDPRQDNAVMKALSLSDAPYWGAVEWLYQGEHTKEQWVSALSNTLLDNRLRYLCIYNWSGIKNQVNCLRAIQEIIEK